MHLKLGVLSFEGMSHPTRPSWFGRRYPTWDDLLDFAEELGCRVGFADLGDIALFVAGGVNEPPVILLPCNGGILGHWLLAHELGHLVHHLGPRGELLYSKDEATANKWAVRALIPELRVKSHANASLDAFIGALSAHYEDIPLYDCPARRLAAKIATIRLRAVQEVA